MPLVERYAILSDIHGNVSALRAALAMAKEYGAQKILCLGDIVGYGASVKECVDLVRANCAAVVQGNHDAQVLPPRAAAMRPEAVEALEYAARVLPPEDVAWLSGLPHPLKVDNQMVLAHGALTNRDDYILDQQSARNNLELLARDFFPLHVLFFGHTHLPMALTATAAKTDFRAGGVVSVQADKQYLFNPGSVGQPRDGNPAACFCIYDTADSQVIYLRAEYDIAAEQEAMRKAGLPDKSIRRIAIGK